MPFFEIVSVVDFHPVGQGLFSTGWLGRWPLAAPGFHWVYDCGSSSKKRLLQDALGTYEAEMRRLHNPRPRLDLVVISHFDKDHISGLVSLLRRFSVRTLVLPYLPLDTRLEVAFAADVRPDQPAMQFFINPVAYLAGAVPEATLGEIIFVPGSGTEGEAVSPAEPIRSPPEGQEFWKVDADSDNELGDDGEGDGDFAELNVAGTQLRAAVRMLRRGGSLRVVNLWEFVPYNDADVRPQYAGLFQAAVAGKRKALMAPSSDDARQAELGALKRIYDQEFGSSAKMRNIISLFLYAGPITRRPSKGSILYTGDGYLDSPRRLANLSRYLGNERMERVCVFQVMHHGARGNWFPGLAGSIKPTFSVFSSDPNHKRYRHPHAPVLRDFWPYHPKMAGRMNKIGWYHEIGQ